jgi:NAD-dependent SIR2 family protein deacetylase
VFQLVADSEIQINNLPSMNKTVYILGAGFSINAGAPSQEKLVEKIFEIAREFPGTFEKGSVRKFRGFLTKTLNVPKILQSKIPLEDIFTPLDKCLVDNLSFRNLSIDEVKKMRGLVYYLIGKTLQHLLRFTDKEYINQLANYLVEECKVRQGLNYRNVDNVSVITTNWDILLDSSIQDIIDNQGLNAVVDYCCHISSFNKWDERVKPGLEILGKGGFNIKLLKLHGSLNWLQCPRCQRVYVDLDDKIAINQYTNPENCRHCDENFGIEKSHKLTSNIIMPTFLKNLSNPQYKLIWQNAGIELSEANKIVFIGYSLPQADFEMRQLLSRMVRKDAEIEVVGFSSDPKNDKDFRDLKTRYEIFFGKRINQPVFHEGAQIYIKQKF